jgi:hypothetical protein
MSQLPGFHDDDDGDDDDQFFIYLHAHSAAQRPIIN